MNYAPDPVVQNNAKTYPNHTVDSFGKFPYSKKWCIIIYKYIM